MPEREGRAAGAAGAYAFLPGNDDARDNPKSHLRNHKPEPVDPVVEHRIHDSENAVNQTRPQDGRDEASQQNRPPRKHRQHRAVEQPDQQRRDQMNGRSGKREMKCGDLRVVSSAGKKPAARRLIGYQMLWSQDTVKHRQNRHGHASSQTALDSRRNRIDLQRQPRSLQLVRDLHSGHFAARRDAGTSAATGTDSCCSCGRTSRNQPTPPMRQDRAKHADARS